MNPADRPGPIRTGAARWRNAGPVILVTVLLAAAACGSSSTPTTAGPETTEAAAATEVTAYAGYQREPIPSVAELGLPAVEADGSETPFLFRAQPDSLLLVYFGYTSCPDVCPTTLSDVRLAGEQLGADADRVDLAMVTIDPEVDSPEVLVGYVRTFVPDAVALRTTDDARLRPVADRFGADYGKEVVDGEAEVFHTASIYAVDDQGRLLMTWPFGIPPTDLATDLQRLLADEA
ncbi:MAG: SCO family protein [Acidimicrobiales bacterium]